MNTLLEIMQPAIDALTPQFQKIIQDSILDCISANSMEIDAVIKTEIRLYKENFPVEQGHRQFSYEVMYQHAVRGIVFQAIGKVVEGTSYDFKNRLGDTALRILQHKESE